MFTCLASDRSKDIYTISIFLVSIVFSVDSQTSAIHAANHIQILQGRSEYVTYNTKVGNTGLLITTDKRSYSKGEIINITIRNDLDHSMKFPNSIFGLNIQNVNTGQKAGLFGIQVLSELKPFESRSIKWDQKDTNAEQVEPGIYQAKISSISNNASNEKQISSANTTFAIRDIK